MISIFSVDYNANAINNVCCMYKALELFGHAFSNSNYTPVTQTTPPSSRTTVELSETPQRRSYDSDNSYSFEDNTPLDSRYVKHRFPKLTIVACTLTLTVTSIVQQTLFSGFLAQNPGFKILSVLGSLLATATFLSIIGCIITSCSCRTCNPAFTVIALTVISLLPIIIISHLVPTYN